MKIGYFLGVVLLMGGLNEEAVSKSCSCVTLHAEGLTWPAARNSCQHYGGDLVSMETVKEWQAVKNIIQNQTNKFNDDWHIGLYLNLTVNKNWTWVSGKPLVIDRWQPWQPRDDAPYVVMTRNYPAGTKGLFNDVRGDIFAGFICEQKSDCSMNGKTCKHLGNIVQPKATTAQQDSGPPIPTTILSTTAASVTTQSKPSAMASLVNAQLPSGFVHWAVAVIPLACVIVVLFCVIGVLVWRLKRRASRKENGEITVNAIHYDVKTNSILRNEDREKNLRCANNVNMRVNFEEPREREAPAYHALQQKNDDVDKTVEYAALYKKPTNCPINRRLAIRRKTSNELDGKYPIKTPDTSTGEYAESCWPSPNQRSEDDSSQHEYHILTSDYGEPAGGTVDHETRESDNEKSACSDDELSYLEIIA